MSPYGPTFIDAGWAFGQGLEAASSIRSSRKSVKTPLALSDAIGRCLAGGVCHLDEGEYFVYGGFDFQWDDLTVVGEGERTVIHVMTPNALVWSGDRGRLERVRIELNPAVLARMIGYGFRVTGTKFVSDLVTLAGMGNALELTATATYARILNTDIEGQTGVGILGTGAYHLIQGCHVNASGAAIEVSSLGAGSTVLACWCVGGNITVAGAGSVGVGNHV